MLLTYSFLFYSSRILICLFGISSSKILDYTSAHIIPIIQGNVAIYNDYIYLVHTTNTSDFELMLNQSIDMLPRFPPTSMYKDILKQQHDEISHILRTIQIPRRHARAIDFLGSALKFVAGNPDHDDYKMLLTKQNFLIENNNKQNKINSVLQARINEITDQLNVLKNKFGENYIIKDEKTPFFEYLANRNNLIINYLNNIALSIVLAKNNIINPLILDEIDIDNLIENENLQITISNLLLVTKIKVLQNANVIHYILKIPKISNICIFLNLHPVSHNDSIVKLPITNAAKCEEVTYPISECVKTTTMNICKPVISNCLSELLNNNSASCATESSHHLPLIEEIDDGIIILNDVYPTILEDKQKFTLKGTILLMFADSIKINDTMFTVKKNGTHLEAHPPKTVAMKFLEHDHKISLPFLHKLNIENTNLIQNISDDLETHTMLWWLTLIAVMVIFFILFLICVSKLVCQKKTGSPSKESAISAEQLNEIISNINLQNEDVRS